MDGDIEVEPSLMALLCLCIANRDAAADAEAAAAAAAAAAASVAATRAPLAALAALARSQLRKYGGVATAAVSLTGAYWRHLSRNNTVAQARRNISAHYDLSNELFSTFLSNDMTYSCAMFESPGEALQCAQERKLRSLADKAGVQPGHRVLEIGFGWGSLSILLAKHYGCHVTVSSERQICTVFAGLADLVRCAQGITLSEQQLALASARVKAAGVEVRALRCVTRAMRQQIDI